MKISTLCAQYEAMLTFFKQHGALLSHIRPEHFLSKDLYVKYMLQTYPGISKRRCERQHAQKSAEAWLHTIYQCIRIFLLNRVTPKVFRNLPGMQDDPPPAEQQEQLKEEGGKVQPARDTTAILQCIIDQVMG